MNYLEPKAADQRNQNTKKQRPESNIVCLHKRCDLPRVLNIIYDKRGTVDGKNGTPGGNVEDGVSRGSDRERGVEERRSGGRKADGEGGGGGSRKGGSGGRERGTGIAGGVGN